MLDSKIVVDALELLEKNTQLACLSADMMNTTYNWYEPYSNTFCTIFERCNTWFCFYKKSAQVCKTSHYYFDEVDLSGQKCKYDSAARFQRDLRYKHNLFCGSMCNQSPKYAKMYVHYGAFSKNKNLTTPEKVKRYRTIVLLAHRGLSFLPPVLNRIVCKIGSFTLKLYKKEIAERATYNLKSTGTDF